MGLTDQARKAEGIPTTKAPGTTVPTTGKPAGKSVVVTGSNENVRDMQRLMSDLQTQLSSQDNKNKIATSFKKPADQISSKIQGISNTGIGSAGTTNDGVWGPKTKTALVRLQDFINWIGAKATIQTGKGDNPYKEMKPEEINTAAQSNINAIHSLFSQLGLTSSIPQVRKPGEGPGDVLDKINSTLTAEAAKSPSEYLGDMSIFEQYLSDVVSFFNLIKNLNFSGAACTPLETKKTSSLNKNDGIEKFAEFILNNTLFTLSDVSSFIRKAQDADIKPGLAESLKGAVTFTDPETKLRQEKQRGTRAGESAAAGTAAAEGEAGRAYSKSRMKQLEDSQKNIEEAKKSKSTPAQATELSESVCFTLMDYFISWFYNRSSNWQIWLNQKFGTSDKNPLTNQPVSQADLNNAKKYNTLIQNLFRQWERIKANIESQIRANGNEQNPQFDIRMLMKAMSASGEQVKPGSVSSGPGAGGAPGASSSSTRVPGADYEQASEAQKLQGPLAFDMNLYETFRIYGDFIDNTMLGDIQRATSSNVLPHISLRNWRLGDWKQIARRNIKGTSISAQYKRFVPLANALENFLINLLNNWKEEYSSKVSDSIVGQQERLLSQWQNAIQGQKDNFTRTNSQSIRDAEQEEGIPTRSTTFRR